MGRRSKDNQIDWELIEKEYRLGQSTLRQLAATHQVQASAISRKAKRENWVQDKRAAVRALSEAQLLARAKANEKATPTEVDIEVAATVRTNVVLAHRGDAKRARALTMKLLSELEQETGNPGALERIEAALAALPDGEAIPEAVRVKAEGALQRAISLPSRTGVMKSLAESLAKVVAIEREAFSIDEPPQPASEGGLVSGVLATKAKIEAIVKGLA